MTSTSELALDHVGLGVRNLDAARAAFERMGFTLTTRSMHAGALAPGGPVVPWGSGNHCAMFRHGYFELLGLVDETLPSNVKRMVALYEGLHIVALGCESAERTHARLAAAGVAANAPALLERDAAFGPSNDTVKRARFRNIYLDGEHFPEARFILIEHDTPDVLWQEHLMVHPNGAQSLQSTTLVAADVDATVQRLTPVIGAPVSRDGAYGFALARGMLWVVSEAAMRELAPVAQGHAVHRVGAACIGVTSLSQLKAHLDRMQVPYMCAASLDAAESVWVGPDAASHGILNFVEVT